MDAIQVQSQSRARLLVLEPRRLGSDARFCRCPVPLHRRAPAGRPLEDLHVGVEMKHYPKAGEDRLCFCCNRRESQIDHVRVGREGKVLANRMRQLISWYAS